MFHLKLIGIEKLNLVYLTKHLQTINYMSAAMHPQQVIKSGVANN